MQVLLLMAGESKRFKEQGYDDKCFLTIPYQNKRLSVEKQEMFLQVLENVHEVFESKEITKVVIAIREDLLERAKLALNNSSFNIKNVEFVSIKGKTMGASHTALLCEQYLNPRKPVLIVNCDQLLSVDKVNFNTFLENIGRDNFIFTFNMDAEDNKWSFVRLTQSYYVCSVKEKEQISNLASCGWYYYNTATELFCSIKYQMDVKDTYNGEYYLAPSFNYTIDSTRVFNVSRFIPLGTPQDYFNYKANNYSVDYLEVIYATNHKS